jgi:hypothetical protein
VSFRQTTLLACTLFSVSAFAQASADTDASTTTIQAVKPFPEVLYKPTLACVLEKHPKESRRLAAYYLQRRSMQPIELEMRDPDRNLEGVILDGCNVEKYRLSLPFDRLVQDLGAAYEIEPKKVISQSDELARCLAFNHGDAVKSYLDADEKSRPESESRLTHFFFVPPCESRRDMQVVRDEFRQTLRRELSQPGIAQ